jgi:succinate-acetate transporter protein
MKIYNKFADKFGNEYAFESYLDFAKFWFSLSRKVAMTQFGSAFIKLQNAAANSKEARTKI